MMRTRTVGRVWGYGLALALTLGAVRAEADPAAAPSALSAGTPASSATPTATGAQVRIREQRVFEVRVGRVGQSPADRATKATKVLEGLVEEREESPVRVVEEGDVAVVYAGATPVIQLTAADAVAAGDSSLAVHAAGVAARVKQGLASERQRYRAAQGVFSWSLLVFSGLLALLVMRKLGEIAERVRERLAGTEDRPLKLQGMEVLGPGVATGTLAVALGAGRLLGQVAVVYGWVAFALSLFDATRGYVPRLASAVTAPVTGLVQRLVSAAPLVVVLVVTAFALLVLVRFLRVYFEGLARTRSGARWLRPELARATGVLAQVAAVVVTAVAVLPLVTGDEQGAGGRLGLVALLALGLGLTPLAATAAVGAVHLYSRRLGRGDEVRLAGTEGRVVEVTLLETRIEPPSGGEVRVPHLMSLWQPTHWRRAGTAQAVEVELAVTSDAEQASVTSALAEVASALGAATVTLVNIDADGALYRVRIDGEKAPGPGVLRMALADGLRQRGIGLGRRPRATEAST